MIASAWIACGAGLLPRRVRGWGELVMLAGYGIGAAYLFGALMNLWFWPFMAGGGAQTGLGYQAGGSPWQNLTHFAAFSLLTSTTTWDTVRAITCAACILVLGAPILGVLRRTARTSHFTAARPPLGA
jgi:hypothetical protein